MKFLDTVLSETSNKLIYMRILLLAFAKTNEFMKTSRQYQVSDLLLTELADSLFWGFKDNILFLSFLFVYQNYIFLYTHVIYQMKQQL